MLGAIRLSPGAPSKDTARTNCTADEPKALSAERHFNTTQCASLFRPARCDGKNGYLFNHKALAKVFRAKMLSAIEAAGLTLPERYPKDWVVACKSVGSSEKALIYHGRYLYRGVIRERDIVSCGDGQVSFRYRNAKTGRIERRTVSGADFLWLVLQHVLPKGFRRARNFGFLHPNCKRLIA